MSNAAADIFRQAAALNLKDSRREGNLVRVEPDCDMVVTGDIHGQRAALARIIRFAAPGLLPQRRLVLQELIHGPLDPRTGHDRSVEQLLRAARLKLSHPAQVLFVLGNHDVAQLAGSEITKEGRGVCKAFGAGVAFTFGDDAEEVLAAVREFLSSIPLAVLCPGGTFISHSLPSPAGMERFGTDALRIAYRPEDLRRGGAVYEWTWGRGHTPEQLETLAAKLGAEFFVLGHRRLDAGFEVMGPRAITLASDHEHGCVLQFRSGEAMGAATAPACVKPIAALRAAG